MLKKPLHIWKLFLDDIRTPPVDMVLARSYAQAISLCYNFGCPTFISFDHDLRTEETGYTFAKWLIEKDLDYPGFIPDNFSYHIHSANPIGRVNIEILLTRHLHVRKERCGNG